MTKQRVVTCPNRLSGTNVMIGGFVPGVAMRTACSFGVPALARDAAERDRNDRSAADGG